MPKFDVWLYSVLIEADNETEACEKVQQFLFDNNVGATICIDFAERIEDSNA
jgi:hypothetical protein